MAAALIAAAGLLCPAPAHAQTDVAAMLGDLPPGVEVTVVFRASVSSDLPADENEVSVQGTVSSSNLADFLTADPDAGNPFSPTVTEVPTADLSVELSGPLSPVAPGSLFRSPSPRCVAVR